MNAMRSILDTLIVKAQNISSELRPPLLDNLGLSAAIEWQARELKRRCGVECHLMLNESVLPDKNSGTVIMRILQEALANIARHSGATEVSISLCRGNSDDIVLEISDNGCGTTRESIESPLSFGILGMQERARLCHGKLSIQGVAGEGTIIRLEIPHAPGEEAH
jgi:signal transduction histidine kinase